VAQRLSDSWTRHVREARPWNVVCDLSATSVTDEKEHHDDEVSSGFGIFRLLNVFRRGKRAGSCLPRLYGVAGMGYECTAYRRFGVQ